MRFIVFGHAACFVIWTGVTIVLAVKGEPGYAAVNGMIAATNLVLFVSRQRVFAGTR